MYQRFRNFYGPTPSDGVVLADRSPSREEWRDHESESFLSRVVGGRVLAPRRSRGLVSSLWVSPSGRIYAVGSLENGPRGVYVETSGDPYAGNWVQAPLGSRYWDVWGLDDDFVFAWGSVSGEGWMALFDGRSWNEIEAPGPVLAMHGISRELVYAVGSGGLAAWWDGSKWNRQPTQTRGSLTAVWVVSEEEIYATGTARRILAGSIYGWSERVAVKHESWDVTKWNDRVWIAAGYKGLAELDGNTLPIVNKELQTRRVVPGDSLIVVTETAIVATDGTQIRSTLPLSELRVFTDPLTPAWQT
jgi:hypothetical protein